MMLQLRSIFHMTLILAHPVHFGQEELKKMGTHC